MRKALLLVALLVALPAVADENPFDNWLASIEYGPYVRDEAGQWYLAMNVEIQYILPTAWYVSNVWSDITWAFGPANEDIEYRGDVRGWSPPPTYGGSITYLLPVNDDDWGHWIRAYTYMTLTKEENGSCTSQTSVVAFAAFHLPATPPPG